MTQNQVIIRDGRDLTEAQIDEAKKLASRSIEGVSTDYILLGALHDKHIIGAVFASCRNQKTEQQYLEIDGIVVDETFRGSGIGSAMLKRIESGCLIDTIRAEAITPASQLFFQRHGYRMHFYPAAAPVAEKRLN